jgi:prepilin-type N-terminal cleavage/methylation domain-containing protein
MWLRAGGNCINMKIKLSVASGQWIEDSDQSSVISGQKKNKNSPLTTHHSPLTTHHSPLNTGFSFIELMTVVAIMALLIMASMPMFRNYTRGKNLNEGTNMVISALRKTRNAAITERKMYKTAFDTINQAVGIYLVVDSDPNNDQLVENWQKLSEFVNFDTTVANKWYTGNNLGSHYFKYPAEEIYYIEFKTSGSSNSGIYEQKVLLLEESTSDTKLITVNALTGKIGVEE